LDSNQRRHSQRIYSPPPLATRAPLLSRRRVAPKRRARDSPTRYGFVKFFVAQRGNSRVDAAYPPGHPRGDFVPRFSEVAVAKANCHLTNSEKRRPECANGARSNGADGGANCRCQRRQPLPPPKVLSRRLDGAAVAASRLRGWGCSQNARFRDRSSTPTGPIGPPPPSRGRGRVWWPYPTKATCRRTISEERRPECADGARSNGADGRADSMRQQGCCPVGQQKTLIKKQSFAGAAATCIIRSPGQDTPRRKSETFSHRSHWRETR
jgi:hypothetical protein